MKKSLIFSIIGIFILFLGVFSYLYVFKTGLLKAEAQIQTGLEDLTDEEYEKLILPDEQVLGEERTR